MAWQSYYQRKSVLITGGSSGIGLALANRLMELGANVYLLARRQDALLEAEAGLQIHRQNADQKTGILQADVADYQAITAGLQNFIDENGCPDILINSAGITHPAEFQDTSIDIYRSLMEVNYFGTVHTTQAVLPWMVERRSGHIINLCSSAGFVGVYGYSAYSGSKFAVRGYTDTIRAEVKPRGIRMSIVFPADVDTPQLAYETPIKPAVTREISRSARVMQPEAVAEYILRKAARGAYIIVPGFDNRMLYHLNNFLGPLAYPVMDSMVADAIRKTKKTT